MSFGPSWISLRRVGQTQINGSREAPDPASVASTTLSPMYQDEYILGAQMQLSDLWTVGARAISREVKAGMDDACTAQPFADFERDQGLTGFRIASVPGCYLINPGEDVTLNVDTDGGA